MGKRLKRELNIRKSDVNTSVKALDNLLRAEYNTKYNYLDYYAGRDVLEEVESIKYQVIYGRRGTGKTHLLRALQEYLYEKENGYLPVYIDLRSYKPMLDTENSLYFSLIVFQNIIIEILKCVYENIDYIYKEYGEQAQSAIQAGKNKILVLLKRFNRNFDGESFNKIGEVDFKTSEVKRIAASLNLTKIPEFLGNGEHSKETQSEDPKIKYISFSDMANTISELLNFINIERLYCLVDEWSEIPENSQFILAEFIKRTFITLKVTVKIAAIPNRTRLLSENRVGLEDGGDIFGYSLDNRYIYELYPDNTKAFFNELLFKQLNIINPDLYSQYKLEYENKPIHNFQNNFFANQALREISIASAGIPRDFLNIFIGAYKSFYIKINKNRHIAVADIRGATIEWYNADKKMAVDSNCNAKLLLEKIIKEILISKKRCHFLIPEQYEKNEVLNDLIDLRVVHLRKKGISHKGITGVVYNVYYLDYACYTNTNMYHNRINTNLLSEIETIDDFRVIRRVSLEDKFFQDFSLEIGNGFKCPKCGKTVNVNHLAYIKQGLCNNCYEKIT